jgi:hypothetical protein
LKKSEIESGLIAGIKRELSAPEVIEELQRRVRQRLRKGRASPDNAARLAELRMKVDNLADAIANGALRTSPALADRLRQTEAELELLKAQPAPRDPEQLLPEIAERSRAAIVNLERTLMGDPRRARQEIAEHVGPIQVNTTADEIRLESKSGHLEQVLLSATGTGGTRQMVVVAGGRFARLSTVCSWTNLSNPLSASRRSAAGPVIRFRLAGKPW